MLKPLADQLLTLAENHATALDRLIWADATARLTDAQTGQDILVLDDPTGALSLSALASVLESDGRVLSRQRSYVDTRALYETVACLGEEALSRLHLAGLGEVAGKETVPTLDPTTYSLAGMLTAHAFRGSLALGHLPKSHAALADTAHDYASYLTGAGLTGELVLGGNTKHMTKTFNQTLERSFGQVAGLRGKGKHRCLLASNPAPAALAPRPAGALTAFGGVFSGGKPDAGGDLLSRCVLDWLPSAAGRELTLLDLGCGNGSVTATVLGTLTAGVQVATAYATDLDVDAVRSASANLTDYGQVQVSWDDAAARLPAGSVDVLMLNPPFHTGTAVDLTLVTPLLDAALRLLAPGGRLFVVHNSHARYRPQVEERFGEVAQVARTKTFTVLTAQAPHTLTQS